MIAPGVFSESGDLLNQFLDLAFEFRRFRLLTFPLGCFRFLFEFRDLILEGSDEGGIVCDGRRRGDLCFDGSDVDDSSRDARESALVRR